MNLDQFAMSSPLAAPQNLGGFNIAEGGQPSIVAVLWRRKGIILFFLLCGIGVGYGVFTQQAPQFQAAATVEVVRQRPRGITDSALDTVVDLAPQVAFVSAEILSDDVLRSAVELGKLTSFDSTPSETMAMVGRIREKIKILPAVQGLADNGNSDRTLVLVIYESEDAELSTAVVNAVVQSYEEFVNGRHRKAIEGVVGFFKEGRDTLLPKLEELERKYAEFRSTAPLEWTSSGEVVNPFREEAMRLEESVRGLENDSRQLKSKLKLVEEASKGQSNAVAILRETQFLLDDITGVAEMKDALVKATDSELEVQEKLVNLRIQAELLAGQFAANHPFRQNVTQQLEATERALRELEAKRAANQPEVINVEARQEEAAKALLRSYVNGIRKKAQLIDEDIAAMSTRLDEVRTRGHKLVEFENENASYMRQITRYQAMLDSFDSQLEKSNLPTINSGLELHVLRPAGLGVLVGPIMWRNLLFGGLGGVVLGGLIGFLVDWSERTYRNPDEVAATLGLPILAHLPMMLFSWKKKAKKSGLVETSVDPSIVVSSDPHSPGAEAIRAIRTTLFATPSHEAEYRVVQITSALPGDGKSTVVANLAASIAGAHKKVVVVDADLRRPTQEGLFGIESAQGLTDVLNGDCTLEEVLVETPIPGLFVLPTGPKPNNPAEALTLPEFGQLLDDLRAEFDIVIVDTPPLLAVTDASNVASQVDGVMFVMRIGRNVKPMSKRAITLLRSLHVNIIGVVVNAIGDSGYSATYANAWSNSYGGQPGSEYGYGYYRYGSDRYLDASKGQSVTVRGRSDRKSRSLQPTISDDTADQPSDA
jgi:capsular exopolysaccharide synthesis family protein